MISNPEPPMDSKAVSAEELKPCPFCGNTETVGVISSFELDEDEDHGHPDSWAVNCDGSREGNKVAGGCGATSGFQCSVAKAIERWNMRAAYFIDTSVQPGEAPPDDQDRIRSLPIEGK